MMRPEYVHRSPAIDRWQAEVGLLAVRSSRLVTALCAAFAAPLCAMAGVRPFCLHFVGDRFDRFGVDAHRLLLDLPTALYDRADDTLSTWPFLAGRSTRPKVEQEIEDGFLVLGDFDDLRADQVLDVAARWCDRRGSVPKTAGRRDAVTLSCGSGSIDLAQVRRRGGPELRAWIINAPIDAGTGFGPFENAPPEADRLRGEEAAAACGAHVGLHWLAHLNRHGKPIAERWKAERGFDTVRVVDPATGLSALELVTIFSRLATAGEEATSAGLTGWEPGTAKDAVWRCLEAALRAISRDAKAPG